MVLEGAGNDDEIDFICGRIILPVVAAAFGHFPVFQRLLEMNYETNKLLMRFIPNKLSATTRHLGDKKIQCLLYAMSNNEAYTNASKQ